MLVSESWFASTNRTTEGGEPVNENNETREVQEAEQPLFLKSVVSPVDARVEMKLPKMCKTSFYGN